MTDKKDLEEKIEESKTKTAIKRGILTFLTFCALCAGAHAQKEQTKEKDPKEKAKTEVNVGFSNISALELQKNKVIFYNDLMPTLEVNVRKNNFYTNFSASELLMINNSDISAMNNKCLLEVGQYFGENSKVFLRVGRELTEAAPVFFNGVENMKYNTERTLPLFGNLSERAVVGVQTNGTMVELGFIGKNGDGFFVIPNPRQADFWAKVSQSFEKEGWKVTLTAAGELGNNNKVFGAVTATNGQFGITGGGNYTFESKTFNSFLRTAYTSSKSGLTYIVQGMKTGKTYSLQLGMGKNGLQGFVYVDNITASQQQSPEFTTTASLGVSYSFKGSKTIQF